MRKQHVKAILESFDRIVRWNRKYEGATAQGIMDAIEQQVCYWDAMLLNGRKEWRDE